MNIKTKDFIKEIDNTDSSLTIGKALSNIVLAVKADPLRSYLTAGKLVQQDEYEMDRAEYEWIKTAIKEHGQEIYGSALVSGQLLLMFSEFKKDEVEVKE